MIVERESKICFNKYLPRKVYLSNKKRDEFFKEIAIEYSLKRNNFSFNGTQNLSDRLSVSTTASYIQQNATGRMGTGYDNKNPNQSFRQWYNVGVDILEQKAAYEATGSSYTLQL